MEKVYISGKITGDDNFLEKFKNAEEQLKKSGYIVVNPANFNVEGLTWEDYMKVDLAMLEICDAIYMLKDWVDSKGAKIEFDHADALGKTILYEGV